MMDKDGRAEQPARATSFMEWREGEAKESAMFDPSRHTSLDRNSFPGGEAPAVQAMIRAGVTAARMRRLECLVASLQKELEEATSALKGTSTSVMLVSPRLRRNMMRAVKVAWWIASFQLWQKWRAWQHARELRRASPPPLPSVPARSAKGSPKALIIDNRWPQPDRDGGSIDVANLVGGLLAFGFEVTFVADQEYDLVSADRDALMRDGVRCVSSSDAPSTKDLLEREGRDIALCVLSRVNGGGRFLKLVIRHCPSAAVVFKAIDLHFVRVEREARVRGIAADAAIADLRMREELLVRMADATMVVSAAERQILAEIVPGAYVVEMPVARPVQSSCPPFATRRGIGFIGGFAHTPNGDALDWFFDEIWPLVRRDLPQCEFSIVGSDLPPHLIARLSPGVHYLGHLPDIGPWFDSLRLSVAPLRFGAGAKGKVASSLAAGVPCVTTSIGAEGMRLHHGETVLVADTAQDFAARIRDAYKDQALWERLSANGLAHAALELSPSGWRDRLGHMLANIGTPPNGKAALRHECPITTV
jgi:glycosyltransferase involved in cell wall biosynthesis